MAVTAGQQAPPAAAAADSAFQTIALTYPLNKSISVPVKATTRLPGAFGEAKIRRTFGVTEIDFKAEGLKPAFSFGGDLNAYVVWTVSPAGIRRNVGELTLKGNKGSLQATTPLASFALLVTAEPHYLVQRPSLFLVLENADPGLAVQGVFATPMRYDDLESGYRYDRATLTGAPEAQGRLYTSRYQAVVAVRLAEEAKAQQYAPDLLQAAQQALSDTQRGFAEGAKDEEVALRAGRAIQLAVEAQMLAIERQEAEALRQERQTAKETIERLSSGKAQAEAEAFRAGEELKRVTAEDAKLRAELAEARRQVLEANREADRFARLSADAQRTAQSAEEQAAAFKVRLHNALGQVADIEQTERGLTVYLPDILFASGESTLRQDARDVLAQIAGILLVAPEYKLSIEGHTDNTGRATFNQRLSERRAATVANFLVQRHISPALITTRGFGESRPVASNKTAEGRQNNRRVELILEGLVR